MANLEKTSNKPSSKRFITIQELEKHNTPQDLWISIQGKVYDVTHWVKDHPGGEIPLENLAGQDVTDAFVAYHPGSAWKYLDQFFIGYFQDYKVSEVSKDYRKLLGEFAKAGMFEKKGNGVYYSMLFMLSLLFISVYGVLRSENIWVHLGSACVMGFLWIQSGWIGHDSGHYQILKNKGLNRFVQVLTGNCVTGISIGWWKRNHNAHHIAVNSLDYDPDLQHIPLFAVSSKFFSSLTSNYYDRKMHFNSIARFFISYQHWTFYPVMAFARFNLFAQSILLLISNKKVPDRGQEIFGVVAFWIWFSLLVSCLPNWGERVMYVVASFVVTGLQHVQFTLNHFSTHVYVGKPCGNDWFEAQTKGSLDVACYPWMDWFYGGLQFQIEHHLFPRLPRCHFRKIAPIVEALCEKHDLPYISVSFWKANLLTIRTLRTAAFQARDASNLAPRNLLWEAVNTHG